LQRLDPNSYSSKMQFATKGISTPMELAADRNNESKLAWGKLDNKFETTTDYNGF